MIFATVINRLKERRFKDPLKIIKNELYKMPLDAIVIPTYQLKFAEYYERFLGNETQVSLGDVNSAILTSMFRLFTWGNNFYGQLGDRITSNQSTPTQLNIMSVYSNGNIGYIFNENISDNIPLREGYIFDGWYFDKELKIPFNLTNIPANDLILYGKWVPIKD
jgi:uncharacterized repeat protein (TIGR02543 family)